MASTSDLVGSHVGESQRKTNEMLEKARGKVLVIDEAYNLDDNMYGKQVSYLHRILCFFLRLVFIVSVFTFFTKCDFEIPLNIAIKTSLAWWYSQC